MADDGTDPEDPGEAQESTTTACKSTLTFPRLQIIIKEAPDQIKILYQLQKQPIQSIKI